MIKMRWLIAGIGIFSLSCTHVFAEEAQDETPLKAYLDCINQQAKRQSGEESDKVKDPQSIIDQCAQQKQSLLSSMSEESAQRIIAQIEKHLRERQEKAEPPTQ